MSARTTTSTDDRIPGPAQAQSIFLGCVVAFILILLFGGLVSYFLLQRREYKVNKDIPAPVLNELVRFTNGKTINVTGTAKSG